MGSDGERMRNASIIIPTVFGCAPSKEITERLVSRSSADANAMNRCPLRFPAATKVSREAALIKSTDGERSFEQRSGCRAFPCSRRALFKEKRALIRLLVTPALLGRKA